MRGTKIAVVGLGSISVGGLIRAGREEALAALCDCRKGTLNLRIQWLGTIEGLHVKPADVAKFPV